MSREAWDWGKLLYQGPEQEIFMPSVAPPSLRVALALLAGAVGACASSRAPSGAAPRVAALPDATEPVRIRFARGTTSGILDDSLPSAGTRSYIVGADQGQVMLAHAIAWHDERSEAPAGETSVRVFQEGGSELPAAAPTGSLWFGRLPATGDYLVRVSTPGAATYTLAVQIPRTVPVAPSKPARSYSGIAPSWAPVDFLVRGEAGRELLVTLRSMSPGTYLHVFGLDDGIQLARVPDRRQFFRGWLSATQDYVISVIPEGAHAHYEVTVELR